MNFTVIRSKWYRGKGADDSKLLNKHGMSCCLGFVGSACGISDLELEDEPSPEDTRYNSDDAASKWPEWMFGNITFTGAKLPNADSPDCRLAMAINDNPYINDDVRESKLIELFAKHGDTLTFVD